MRSSTKNGLFEFVLLVVLLAFALGAARLAGL